MTNVQIKSILKMDTGIAMFAVTINVIDARKNLGVIRLSRRQDLIINNLALIQIITNY